MDSKRNSLDGFTNIVGIRKGLEKVAADLIERSMFPS